MAVDFYSFFRDRIRALPYISASARGELYRNAIRAYESFIRKADPPIAAEEANAVWRQIHGAMEQIEAEFDLALRQGRRMPAWAWGDETGPDVDEAQTTPEAPAEPPRLGGYDHPGELDPRMIRAMALHRSWGLGGIIWRFDTRIRAISAILRHYVHSTAGSDVLGYMWTLFEPLMQVTIVVSMYWFFGISSIQGMPAIPFAITGIGCWLMIRMIMMRTGMGLGREFGLCTFPVIIPLDVKIAKALFYSTMYFVVCGFFILLNAHYEGSRFEVDDFIKLMHYWIMLTILAFGIGLAMGRLFTVIPEAQRLIMVILRAMYLLSGAFIISEQMPTEYVKYVIWNPILHGIQLFRSAFFLDYESVDASPLFFTVCTLGILVFGVICERANYREEVTA